VQGAVDKAAAWVDKGTGYVQRGVQFTKDLVSILGRVGDDV
jgi:hypothetical protein